MQKDINRTIDLFPGDGNILRETVTKWVTSNDNNTICQCTQIIHTFLEMSESTECATFQAAMLIAKDVIERCQEHMTVPRIPLIGKASIKLFRCVSEHCYSICMEKMSKGDCSDERYTHANELIGNMFQLFLIRKTTWAQNTVYMLSIMAVASQKPDPFIQNAFSQLANDPRYEKAFYDMCRKVVTRSKSITYTKVFDLTYFASLYVNSHDERRSNADKVALALLMEEEKEEKKEQHKKKKKLPKPKKVPRIDDDDDAVYEEVECIVCMDADCEVMFGCGHKICCTECAPKLLNNCPYCKH